MNFRKDTLIYGILIVFFAIAVSFGMAISPLIPILVVAVIFALVLMVMFLTGRLTFYHYMLMFVPMICLSPMIPTGGGPDVRLDDIWFIFGAFILLMIMSVRRNVNLELRYPMYLNVFVAFIFWVVITIYYSSINEPYFYSHRDWFEVVKNVKLLVLLVLAINLKLTVKQYHSFYNLFIYSLLVAVFFGFAQYFNFANINSWLTPYYILDTQVYNLHVHKRIVGTFGNSNVFAGILALGTAITISKFLHTFKFRHLFVTGIFFIGITLTLSRTVTIISILLLVIVTLQILMKTRRKVATFFAMGFISLGPLAALFLASDSYIERVSRLGNLDADTSFQARLRMWENVYQTRASGNFLLGTGPVKKLHYYYDNEWLALLTHYGVIGVVLFVLFFAILIFQLGKVNTDIGFYGVAVRGALAVYSLYMVTLIVFQQLQMMPIILLLTGVALSSIYNFKQKEPDKKTRRRIVWSH